MRILLLWVLVWLASSTHAADVEALAKKHILRDGCHMSSKEKLVCKALLCNPIGLSISESRSECLKVNRDLMIYLASLGVWEKPKRCMARNKDCVTVGRASNRKSNKKICNQQEGSAEKHACLLSLGLNEKTGAETHLVNQGKDIEALDVVEFDEVSLDEIAEPVITAGFMLSVDERFAEEGEDLERRISGKRGRSMKKIAALNAYLQYKDRSAQALLIESGEMDERCTRVSEGEFFNCFYYSYLPQVCWSIKAHDDIALCAVENTPL